MPAIDNYLGTPGFLELVGADSGKGTLFSIAFNIGATGAVGTATNLPGGVTLVRSAQGLYTLNLPSCRFISVQGAYIEGADPVLLADRRTVKPGAIDAPAGTVDFQILVEAGTGAGVNPADGSVFHISGILDWS